MKAQIIIIATLAALLQVESALLSSKPSGGLFSGGLFGKKEAEFNPEDALGETAPAPSKNMFSQLQDRVSGAVSSAQGLVEDQIEVGKGFGEKISAQVESNIQAVKNTASNAQSLVEGQIESGKGLVQSNIETAKDLVGNVQTLAETPVESVQAIAEKISTQVESNIEAAKSSAQEVVGNVQGVIGSQLEAAKGVGEMIADKARSDISLVQGFAGRFSDMVESFANRESIFSRLWAFLTGWMRPSSEDFDESANEVLEDAPATLTGQDGELPVLSQAGLLQPPSAPPA